MLLIANIFLIDKEGWWSNIRAWNWILNRWFRLFKEKLSFGRIGMLVLTNKDSSGHSHLHNSFLFVNLQFEQTQHHCIHSAFCQVGLSIFRKEYTKVQDGLHELVLTTKFISPLPKCMWPVFVVFLNVVLAVPQEIQLVLAKFVTVDSCQVLIKRIQRRKVSGFKADYFFCEGIIQSKWIVKLLINFFRAFNQFLQETILRSKLNIFEEVVLIKREEFSYHMAGVSQS